MSIAPPDAASERITNETAKRVLNRLWDHAGYCSFCFGIRRRYYTAFDEARDDYFDRTGKSGPLAVVTATSDAAPGTFTEVVPGKQRDAYGAIKAPARPKTVCSCGVVDYDPGENRSQRVLLTCIENIDAALARDGWPFNATVATRFIYRAAEKGALRQSRGVAVLTRAVKLGLKHARNRATTVAADPVTVTLALSPPSPTLSPDSIAE